MRTHSVSSPSRQQTLWLAVALVGLVVVAYLRAIRGEFLWDDDSHVYKNPVIIGPLGLKEIWTTAAANYFPLVLTNFWFQHALWGLNPVGYHLVTLAFHAAAVLALWRILVRLGVPGAWFGAALWGLHPVQAESVAWICELKNTQSGLFFFLSILSFLQWLDGRTPIAGIPDSAGSAPAPHPLTGGRNPAVAYAMALLWALMAILSKPSTVMLPVALGLIWWWRDRARWEWRPTLWLAPFFLLSAIASGWAVWEQKFHSGAIGAEWNQTLPQRAILAGNAVWFYFGKLIWPAHLTFIYPRWTLDATNPLAYVPGLAVLGVLAWLWRLRHRAAGLWVAAMYFVALLFPVLGFFSVYFFRYSFVGDHFQYLAAAGPLAAGGALVSAVLGARASRAGAFAVAVYLGLTAYQCADYLSREHLWQATVARNPSASMAWVHLGDLQVRQGRHDEAIRYFLKAIAVDARDIDAHNNLGAEYLLAGRDQEAADELTIALRLKPDNPEAHNNLGYALSRLGRSAEALQHYQESLRLKPAYADAHNNLGLALVALGRWDEAIAHYIEAVRLKPKDPDVHYNYANALRASGRTQDSLAHYERSLALEPGRAEVHDDYGLALMNLGRLPEAVAHYERSLQLNPRLPSAHNDLGVVFARTGRMNEALARFQEAVRLDANYLEALMNLGAAFTALDRWPDARDAFARAVTLKPDYADARRKYAMALANTSAVAEALAQLETALKLDPSSPDTHLALAQLLQALGRASEAAEHRARAETLQRERR